MKQRQMLADGATDTDEFKNTLANGNFGRILHWNKSNPFNDINIAQASDNKEKVPTFKAHLIKYPKKSIPKFIFGIWTNK